MVPACSKPGTLSHVSCLLSCSAKRSNARAKQRMGTCWSALAFALVKTEDTSSVESILALSSSCSAWMIWSLKGRSAGFMLCSTAMAGA